MVERLLKRKRSLVRVQPITSLFIFSKGGKLMSSKRKTMVTIFRIISLIVLVVLVYRSSKMEVIFTAIALLAICFWGLPYCLSGLIFVIFKMKDDFGGTLQYDDSDPTDCRFRMIFNFDPEDLAKEDSFIVKTERTTLLRQNIELRDRNKD